MFVENVVVVVKWIPESFLEKCKIARNAHTKKHYIIKYPKYSAFYNIWQVNEFSTKVLLKKNNLIKRVKWANCQIETYITYTCINVSTGCVRLWRKTPKQGAKETKVAKFAWSSAFWGKFAWHVLFTYFLHCILVFNRSSTFFVNNPLKVSRTL